MPLRLALAVPLALLLRLALAVPRGLVLVVKYRPTGGTASSTSLLVTGPYSQAGCVSLSATVTGSASVQY